MSDNQYVAAVVFYNIKNSEMLYGMQGFGELQARRHQPYQEYDITGFGETFGMIVHDYAGNSKMYTVTAQATPTITAPSRPPTSSGPRTSTRSGSPTTGASRARAAL